MPGRWPHMVPRWHTMHCLSLKLPQDVYFCGLLVKGKEMSQVFAYGPFAQGIL